MMRALRVLIVDDAPVDAAILRRLLTAGFGEDGVQIAIATSAAEALGLPLIDFDAILLDLNVGDTRGRATFDVVHAQAPLTPIILVTGTSDEQLAESLLRGGAQDYLVKGEFNVRQLRRSLRHAIERQNLLVQVDRLRDDLAIAEVAARRDDDVSAQVYRKLIEAAPVGIMIIDARGSIEHANSALASLVGYSIEELTSMDLTDLMFEADVVKDPPRPDLVHARGSLRRERVLRTRTGTPVIVEMSALPIDDRRVLSATRDVTQLRRTQEESAFQASLLAHVQDAIIATDRNGRITFWNSRAERLHGWTRDEAIGQLVRELITPPEMAPTYASAMDAVFASGHWEGNVVLMRRDGTRVPVFVSFSATYDACGEVSGVVGVSYDRTELKKAEEARAQNELLLNSVLDNLSVGVWIIDKSGMIVRANPEARRVWGGARYESIEGPSYKAFFAETGEQMTTSTRPSYVTLKTGNPVIGVETEIEAFDGQRRRIIMSSLPVRTPEGESLGIVVVNHDVTDLRAAEEKVRKNNAMFRSLMEHLSDIITVLDPSGVMLYQSPSIETVLGYKPADLAGRSIFDFIRQEDGERIRAHLLAQIASDEPARIDVEFRDANGGWRAFECITTRSMAEGRAQIIATSRDVTERNALARSLEQATRVASLGRLATSIAHEINNILMGIQPFAEVIMRRSNGQADVKSASEQIARSIQRGKRVTEEILRFAKPSEPQKTPVRLLDFIAAIQPELRTLLPETIALRAELPPDDVWISVDRDQMAQVMTNLVLNARDANATAVVIGAGSAGDSASITIADNGAGMPHDIVDKIFEPLFTTKQRGTGLGLSIVHQIVTRHGGRIDVASAAGAGSSFTIALPRVTPVETAASSANADAQWPESVRRILLVEDDAAVAAGLSSLLRLEAFEVSTVSRGSEVEAEIEHFRPDALILDYGLPDESGATVYERVAKRWPHMPTIFSTGEGEAQDIKQFLAQRRVAFLLKPYDFPSLLAELRKVAQP